MTTLRPERPSDGPMSYDSTGQFKAVVEQLNDPLNDPLPGHPPAVQEPEYPRQPFPDPAASPWFPTPEHDEPPVAEPAVMAPPVYPTARMPVVAEPDVPAEDGGPEDVPLLAPPPPLPPPASPPVPADGGRAARRKAARQGGGHRAGGHGRSGAAQGPGTAQEAASAPLSRVEARRAAKAAKDSPAVVASRVVGELFITVGVLMLLFVTYQLWWTNVRAHQQANGAANNLQHQWDSASADPNRVPGTFSPGQGFAIMYIPKLDVKAPIAQGISKHDVLDKGMIGHYDGSLNTAMPWDKSGNFAVAAHRNTHGEPFRYINHLQPGDKVVVETATEYYTYVITGSLASTPPANVSVLKPIPVGSGFTAPGRYLTLTTCTPEFTSTNRLIVWGKLAEERPRSKGKPDALVGG
ncbi:class E sortase [Actinacidiphila paucisporea]|uniref:Sortase A n=1 Tax=Actinacidiphila paucisporea TaxID=310782 RepID=A0A1M7C645_9ACTN|nr:class E sortase [Actinacidiphila paucisporea]SHL62606.1 sortase A [Actinacidiphila paucisporea]